MDELLQQISANECNIGITNHGCHELNIGSEHSGGIQYLGRTSKEENEIGWYFWTKRRLTQ